VTFDVRDIFHTLKSFDCSDFDFDPVEACDCRVTYCLDEKEFVSPEVWCLLILEKEIMQFVSTGRVNVRS
jgi:hypothetical protein